MEIKNTSKEVIESIEKWIDSDETERFEIQGEGYFYDREENIFIDIDFINDNIEFRTFDEELEQLVFDYDEDDDYADCLIEAIKHDYEGTARHDLFWFACDKYDKKFYLVNDRW